MHPRRCRRDSSRQNIHVASAASLRLVSTKSGVEAPAQVVGCPAGSKTKLFADMAHGWVPRGDVANADVKRDVALAMSEAIAYFADKLPLSQGGCMGCL